MSAKTDQTYSKLRRFNLIMGFLHLIQGAFMWVVSNDTTYPVFTNFLSFDTATFSLSPQANLFYELPLGPSVAIFLLLSAVAHFYLSSIGYTRYVENLKLGKNPIRFYEYALSSSLMIVLIGMLAGVWDLGAIILMFGLNAMMNLLGLLMESLNQGREKLDWTPFTFGSIAGIIPWLVIFIYFFGSIASGGEAKPPAFVYAIIPTLFVFFNTFAVNMYLQYKKIGPWKNYLYGERAFIILSLVAKTVLAWMIFAGTLAPVQNEKLTLKEKIMKISIVTDSTCDLPASIVEKHGITVVPLYINQGDKSYLDGVNLTREEFYRLLPTFYPAPSTATPSTEVFAQAWNKLADAGAQAILSIHISEKLSATINAARVAAEQFTRIPVTVLDSSQLSLGLGFIVEKAAQMAELGHKMEDILASLADLMKRTYVFASLKTLEYLRRSGRMNFALARFGEFLQIKPLLHMNQGNPVAHRVRTQSKATARMMEWLNEYAPFEKLAIVHAGVQHEAEEMLERIKHLLPNGEIPIVQITPALGSHLGVGALGFACVSKENQS